MSIVVDNPNILKSISRIAKRENKPETKVLEEVIKKGLKETEPKIPEHLIANKDTYNPDPKRLMESAGFIKGVKPFNAVELVREMRRGE
ncbi:hypothetical protein [Methanobrevibacter curvatus]|uniref:Uncharacterized protein n=1 Tax=Methanobrevibacter curvatus TaxID=49547 RepID=A0A162FJM5_9EURY|nr:hypothetical protein [Methanobrevibacter curvatus]KZX10980.1 hypothetical protein MBCUR_16010 [Methanobrevibacter curvatus]